MYFCIAENPPTAKSYDVPCGHRVIFNAHNIGHTALGRPASCIHKLHRKHTSVTYRQSCNVTNNITVTFISSKAHMRKGVDMAQAWLVVLRACDGPPLRLISFQLALPRALMRQTCRVRRANYTSHKHKGRPDWVTGRGSVILSEYRAHIFPLNFRAILSRTA
ncbi:hypothetical protein OBBRIDRAFT_380911 [Obba rivulosa]|uniref:Uncharacterized protein n=1 Tax=Obba rivulosa TaxID=1052685 RepID=A0A8E2B1K7_9APHY|nr:hypothetical protein OBBRIDRAFT_380911 [Obba rivulosa]